VDDGFHARQHGQWQKIPYPEPDRETLAIEVDTSLPGTRVVSVLERLKRERGIATKIIVDNGPEFLSRVVDQWAFENGVEFLFIDLGKPT
jgi:putative transposase